MIGRDGKERVGPLVWCKRCSRHHHSQASCNLVRVTRVAKSGRKTTRLAHIKKATNG